MAGVCVVLCSRRSRTIAKDMMGALGEKETIIIIIIILNAKGMRGALI